MEMEKTKTFVADLNYCFKMKRLFDIKNNSLVLILLNNVIL